ncbi:hypothetical protein MCGE09_00559, partial [Thaumarchaeota archaeon SCGC AB-539-E09]
FFYYLIFYCTYWTWEKKPSFFRGIKKLYGQDLCIKRETTIKNKIVKKWMMKKVFWYCENCPACISYKNISAIKKYLFS